ncbi:MAG: HD domain-containing protein [Wenzhouxiangellaceae bacterium]|nr:HD domain-containing protein [Wenzhouxiangellaceae bacterium]
MLEIDWDHDGDEIFDCEVVVEPAHVEIGHFVSRLDRPWRDTPFPLEGVMVTSQNQRDWFCERCRWVVIDLLRSRNGHRPVSARAYRPLGRSMPAPPPMDEDAPANLLRRAEINPQTIADAMESQELLYRQAASLIDALRRTGRIDSEQARLNLRQIAATLETNIAAMVWLTRIRAGDENVAEHSVNVAIMAMGLARSMDWDDRTIEQAGLAGLLHDIGMLKLAPELSDPARQLEPAERKEIRRHCKIGYELVRDDPQVAPEVARAVLEHHEQPDGGGYPDGKRDYALADLSKMIAVVNAYDAMTEAHINPAPRSHHDALGELWRQRDHQFDAGMVEALIRFLGWVTPGALVRLSDQRYAVVLHSSHKNRLWPIVRCLKLQGDGYVPDQSINLAEQSGPPVRIAEVLPDGAIAVDLNEILLQEAMAGQAPRARAARGGKD